MYELLKNYSNQNKHLLQYSLCLLKTKQDDKTSNTQNFYFDILSCKLIPDLLKILNVHEMLNQNQDLITKILECVIFSIPDLT